MQFLCSKEEMCVALDSIILPLQIPFPLNGQG